MKHTSPIKPTLRTEALSIGLIALTFLTGVYFYANFPSVVATHWNFQGEVDGYMPKGAGTFAIPIIMTLMYVLFLMLPVFDPKKERYEDFAPTYRMIKQSMLILFFVLYIATGLFNLGYPVKIGIITPILIGALMMVLGNSMGKLKNNYFVGIKTPWTLSSENVWNRTHRFGGWMFVIWGLGLMVSWMLPPAWGFIVLFGGVLLLVGGTFFYSWWEYRKEKGKL